MDDVERRRLITQQSLDERKFSKSEKRRLETQAPGLLARKLQEVEDRNAALEAKLDAAEARVAMLVTWQVKARDALETWMKAGAKEHCDYAHSKGEWCNCDTCKLAIAYENNLLTPDFKACPYILKEAERAAAWLAAHDAELIEKYRAWGSMLAAHAREHQASCEECCDLWQQNADDVDWLTEHDARVRREGFAQGRANVLDAVHEMHGVRSRNAVEKRADAIRAAKE